MSSIDYINELAARGVQLWVQEGKLQYKAPKEAVTPQLLADLKTHKATLIALLEQFAGTAGAYPLAPLRQHYKDCVQHEAERLQGPAGRALAAFWEQELARGLPTLQLATDRMRPPIKTENGKVHELAFGPGVSRSIKEAVRVLHVTPYMLLLAVYQLWLFLHTGQPRFALGAPTAGRNLPGSEHVLGHFVNTTVLACELQPGEPFSELVARTRAMVLRVLEQQDCPFPLLLEKLRPPRDASRSPVFQLMYNWNPLRGNLPADAAAGDADLMGERLAASSTGTRGATHDLTLNIQELGAGYVSAWTYNTDLFDATTVAAFAAQYVGLVQQVLADPGLALVAYRLAAAPVRAQWLARIADASQPAEPDRALPTRARAHGERLVWQLGGRVLLGADIEDAVATLGATLKEHGVGPGSVVGVQLASAAEMAVALQALVDLGASAQFLAPRGPDTAEPVAWHSEPLVAVGGASSTWVGWAPAGISVDSEPRHRVATPGNAAVPAARLAAFIAGLGQALDLQPSSRLLLPVGMDLRLSAAAMLAAFACGASISIRSEVSLDGLAHEDTVQAGRHAHGLAEYAAQRGITALLVPVLLLPRLGGAEWPRLDAVLAYGEHPQAVASIAQRHGAPWPVRFMPQFCLNQWAGPLAFVPDGPAWRLHVSASEPVVLGPLGDLADDHQRGRLHLLVPGGLRGAGDAAADTTGQSPRDLADACRSHVLMATPLAARRRPDGVLLCDDPCGRRIEHRVAPFEIGLVEAAMARQPEVRQVACDWCELPQGPMLIAYVERHPVHEPPARLGDALRQRLAAHVPDYMLPQAVVEVAHWPLQSDGRLDRLRLPVPPAQAAASRSLPATEVEDKLAAIWRDVLALSEVGMDDDFFALGGDSILAAVIVSRCSLEGLYLKPRDVFEHPTVAGLAQVVAAAPEIHVDQGLVTGEARLGPAQAWFFDHVSVDRSHFNQALLLPLQQAPEPALMNEALRQVARQHDVLRARFMPVGAGWRQVFANGDADTAAPDFASMDCIGVDGSISPIRRADAIAAAQRSLDIERGPLWAVRWLAGATLAESRLLVVVHHLLIDGVSWSLLLQDLGDTYLRLQARAVARLPLKTTSYKAWVEQLGAHAASEAMSAERSFWEGWARQVQQAWAAGPVLPLADGAGSVPVPLSRRVALDEEQSAAMRSGVHAAYRTDANDLLLAAVLAGFCAWSGSGALLVDVQGHGRDPFAAAVDLSRTIGRFTALYPVLLEMPAAGDVPALIKHVKQRLRDVPHKGTGFGVLRYLQGGAAGSVLAAVPRAPVLFTYLGLLDQMVGSTGLYTGTAEPAPGIRSTRQPRTHPIDLCAYVSAGRLTIECSFDATRLHEAEAERLLHLVLHALAGLVRHCGSVGAGGLTPSDVPAIDIDLAGLDLWLDEVAAPDAR